MDLLFSPRSIAVVGASRDTHKVGTVVLKNHLEGFKGKLFAVNPHAQRILGVPCYPCVSAIGQHIDLAVIAVPAAFVAQVLEDCGKAKVPFAVVLSSGFSESGQDGKILEGLIAEVASLHHVRIVGPNCLGLISPSSGLNTSFVSKMPHAGEIAFISQSGALCSAILDWSLTEGFGFSKFISIGNKADLQEAEFLRYLADDPLTKVILLYIEGLHDGRAFMEACSYARSKKPVLVLKGGRTTAGANAAKSHTGSLTGSDDVYTTAFRQCGALQVETTRQLFDIGRALAKLGVPQDGQVAIVTNSGGPGILASDSAESSGLSLAKLSVKTTKRLSSFLPPQANIHNPVDVIGDADARRYLRALNTTIKDPSVGSVIAMMCPQKMVDMNMVAKGIALASKKTPIVTCFMGGKSMHVAREIFKKQGVPHFENPEEAAEALAIMHRYHSEKTSRWKEYGSPAPTRIASTIIAKARANNRNSLLEIEGLRLVNEYGIKPLNSTLATTQKEALKAARKSGYPVVFKVSSPDILHKTDAKGVILNITDDLAARNAFDSLKSSAKKADARFAGVTVQPMIKGNEVIIGMNRDPQFGPVLLFGLGGVLVEVIKDVSRRVAPVTLSDAKKMIEEIKACKLLHGFRGRAPCDTTSIAKALVALSDIALAHPEISTMEINPLMVTSRGSVAVDVRCVLN
ncbi:MAG TPA: acetate--CoA ligase family protein [Candidatus Nanoarchaeia archaeon]|nr:acetate--CoA ligase family protein [Candidatus Nanoarchaeia archaeon]